MSNIQALSAHLLIITLPAIHLQTLDCCIQTCQAPDIVAQARDSVSRANLSTSSLPHRCAYHMFTYVSAFSVKISHRLSPICYPSMLLLPPSCEKIIRFVRAMLTKAFLQMLQACTLFRPRMNAFRSLSRGINKSWKAWLRKVSVLHTLLYAVKQIGFPSMPRATNSMQSMAFGTLDFLCCDLFFLLVTHQHTSKASRYTLVTYMCV